MYCTFSVWSWLPVPCNIMYIQCLVFSTLLHNIHSVFGIHQLATYCTFSIWWTLLLVPCNIMYIQCLVFSTLQHKVHSVFGINNRATYCTFNFWYRYSLPCNTPVFFGYFTFIVWHSLPNNIPGLLIHCRAISPILYNVKHLLQTPVWNSVHYASFTPCYLLHFTAFTVQFMQLGFVGILLRCYIIPSLG